MALVFTTFQFAPGSSLLSNKLYLDSLFEWASYPLVVLVKLYHRDTGWEIFFYKITVSAYKTSISHKNKQNILICIFLVCNTTSVFIFNL